MQATLSRLWTAGRLPFATEPALLKHLGKQSGNATYLIQADGEYFIAQDKTAGAGYPGVEPQRERRILRQAGACGLAPRLIYHCPQQHVLISEYIDGRSWQAADADNKTLRTRLLDAVQGLHGLKCAGPPLAYGGRIAAYGRMLALQQIDLGAPLAREHEELLAAVTGMAYPPALSHHDLHPENILITAGGLVLLDWEYAAVGWPLVDLAALAIECAIPAAALAEFYNMNEQQLRLAKRLYAHLCALWRLVNARPFRPG